MLLEKNMKAQNKDLTPWQTKLNKDATHQVKILDKKFADMPANSSMLIATPKIIDQFIRKIPKGKPKSLKEMRVSLAKKYSADYTCPVTSGIFLRIVAEAAFESYIIGKQPLDKITPFWRLIEVDSHLAKKLSFGEDFIRQMKKQESVSQE